MIGDSSLNSSTIYNTPRGERVEEVCIGNCSSYSPPGETKVKILAYFIDYSLILKSASCSQLSGGRPYMLGLIRKDSMPLLVARQR